VFAGEFTLGISAQNSARATHTLRDFLVRPQYVDVFPSNVQEKAHMRGSGLRQGLCLVANVSCALDDRIGVAGND